MEVVVIDSTTVTTVTIVWN